MLSHFWVWRCPAYVKHLKTGKLGSKSDKYLFVKYPKKTKGYYFYLAKELKIFVSSRILFLKKEFLRKKINASKIKLGEVHEVEEPAHKN